VAEGEYCNRSEVSRNWQPEEALDALIEQLKAGRITHQQALTQEHKLEASTPDNLEIQYFIANHLWALGLRSSHLVCQD